MISVKFTLGQLQEIRSLLTGRMEGLSELKKLYGTALPRFPQWEAKLQEDIDRLHEIAENIEEGE